MSPVKSEAMDEDTDPVATKPKMIKLNTEVDENEGSDVYDPSLDSYHPVKDAYWKAQGL